MSRSLFVLAGEHSGDLHGSAVLKHLRQRQPGIHFFGVGGPGMLAEGLQPTLPMEQFQVFGFTAIAKKLPQFIRQFRHLRNLILKQQPDAVLLIDYPGFNLRLAKSLRKHGYKGKIVYYVCPTVWAWGKGRLQTLVDNVDLLLPIFPFEPELFAHTSLKTIFVGHPLVERVASYRYDDNWYEACDIPRPKRSLAIFPGSRPAEIQRLFPRQLAAALALRQTDPALAILVSCSDDKLRQPIEEQIKLQKAKNVFLVPRGFTYELMRDCHLALAKSGTVTLELALHEKPCVVVYEISRLNRFIAKYIIRLKLPHYCIVNLLGKATIYPEFIEQAFTVENLTESLRDHYREGPQRNRCLEGCRRVRTALQTSSSSSPSESAARVIEDMLCSHG